MSRLSKQDGILICVQRCCYNDKTIERRDQAIEELFAVTPDTEGADMRVVDQAIFIGQDEEP
jgi:hypothetical protein